MRQIGKRLRTLSSCLLYTSTYAYILCDRGLEVVDLADPLHPKITAEIDAPELVAPTGVAVQFRYAFITDHEGLKVFDLTHLNSPRRLGATLPLADARKDVYKRQDQSSWPRTNFPRNASQACCETWQTA